MAASPSLGPSFETPGYAGLLRMRSAGIAPASSMQLRRPQVEGQGEFKCALFARRVDDSGGVAALFESRQPARFGFVGIDRFCLVGAAAGMGDVVDAAAERAPVPAVDDVER